MKFLLAAILLGSASSIFSSEGYVLSDFSGNLFSQSGWVWQGFSDRVMGGRSDIEHARLVETPDGLALQLSGTVVTRGGGFIQVRLQKEQGFFDASPYAGIEVELKAPNGGNYYIFARTRDNTLPWSYYGASIETTETKSVIRIPWSAFSGQAVLHRSIRPQGISSIALVAAYDDFFADIYMYRIGLYHR